MIPQPIKDYFAKNKNARFIATGLGMVLAAVLVMMGRPDDATKVEVAVHEINVVAPVSGTTVSEPNGSTK